MRNRRRSSAEHDSGGVLPMGSVSWTGETACALQAALQMSNEAFASHLKIGVRTVADWHKKPTTKPQTGMQHLLEVPCKRHPQPHSLGSTSSQPNGPLALRPTPSSGLPAIRTS